MPKILAIDTSTDACSVALLFNNEITDHTVISPATHTKFILPMIDGLLTKANITSEQLDAIAFGRGPGSFTGVRLATSIIQGLAFASNVPVISISTLRVLAQEVFEKLKSAKVLVIQDARMQEVYWGEYEADTDNIMQPIAPDKIVKPQEIDFALYDGFIGVGSGFSVYNDIFKNIKIQIYPYQYVQAKYLVRLAAQDYAKGLIISAEKALPVYLRDKVTHGSI